MANRVHIDREYDARLVELKQRLVTMGGLVDTMLEQAMRSLVERDSDLARRTIAADEELDRGELESDELCLQILARWQPMASDLRFLTISLKMVTDLERMGDLAVNICERAIELNAQPALQYELLPRMAAVCRSMLQDAVRALVERDADLALAVIRRDDEVDEAYHAVFRALLSLMRTDADLIHRGIHIQSIAKWVERVADHATNLAEQVIFLVRGKDVRHLAYDDAT